MTQPPVDLRRLLRGLPEHEVEYVLFALAMAFYRYVRNTQDLDIAVNPKQENLDRVAEWLMSMKAVLKLNPARRFGPRERWGCTKARTPPCSLRSDRSTSSSGFRACPSGRS